MTGFQERKEILVQQDSLASHILDHKETQVRLEVQGVKVTQDGPVPRETKVRLEVQGAKGTLDGLDHKGL
jgi:hypothetical protein